MRCRGEARRRGTEKRPKARFDPPSFPRRQGTPTSGAVPERAVRPEPVEGAPRPPKGTGPRR